MRRAQSGCITARNELVVRNMGLVAAPAKYYARRNPGIELDDIMQAGRIGVLRSIAKFDLDAGFMFSTYATYWIKHELRKLVRDVHTKGLSATSGEVSAYIEGRMSDTDARHYERSCMNYLSLESPAIRGDNHSDLVRDIIEGDENMEESSEIAVLAEQIKRLISHGLLSLHQEYALNHTFGLSGWDVYSRRKIARNLEVAEHEVSSMIEDALEELRDRLGDA